MLRAFARSVPRAAPLRTAQAAAVAPLSAAAAARTAAAASRSYSTLLRTAPANRSTRIAQRRTPSHALSSPLGAASASSAAQSPLLHAHWLAVRHYSMERVRNIGISAHIDSGKTTLTERILFYTGRIHEMHDVKGKDNIGATMDSMELEREKGITIASAATFCKWGDTDVNIIDTPGHVDFTIEVERSLRVLDGAVMVLCGVAGVQSQSLTVDRQMRRYNVPRVTFINKLDRQGANPWKGIEDIRNLLGHNAAAVQIPMGLEGEHKGVIDLVRRVAIVFEGPKGDTMQEVEIPAEYEPLVKEKRHEMIERLAEVDEEIAECFLTEEEPSLEVLKAAIRRQTIALKFVPVFMGSAFRNRGIQPLLDGVVAYLPAPNDVTNQVLAITEEGEEVSQELPSDPKKPFVGLAFKLEERPFGQLTYMRIYQGTLKRGDYLWDVRLNKRVKIQRIVKMHSNAMEDIQEAYAGEIIALFGVDCSSGTTFVGQENLKMSLTSIHCPEPVISLSIAPKNAQLGAAFSKALNRFQKEDPTFRVHVAAESQETIISGMGELHLEIYVERMKREYKVDCIVGQPKVNYRETCSSKASFNYTHKKQTGGSGQYGKVIGYVEPLPEDSTEIFEFENHIVGNVIPPEFFTPIEKGFKEAVEKGLAGFPVQGVRVVLTDGAYHAVDSNEIAFKSAAHGAFREAFRKAGPLILEPVMAVQVEVPSEFQGQVVAMLNRRKGMIENVEAVAGGFTLITADVPLSKMFGYSTDLRSSTEGKGEFTMEYKLHAPVMRDEQNSIMEEFERKRLEAQKAR